MNVKKVTVLSVWIAVLFLLYVALFCTLCTFRWNLNSHGVKWEEYCVLV